MINGVRVNGRRRNALRFSARRLLQVLTRRSSELLDARREPGQVARRTADQQHGCNLGFARRANAALIDQAMPRLANIAFSWLC
jgi:hypothetical protein